jgi:hypothetical protein
MQKKTVALPIQDFTDSSKITPPLKDPLGITKLISINKDPTVINVLCAIRNTTQNTELQPPTEKEASHDPQNNDQSETFSEKSQNTSRHSDETTQSSTTTQDIESQPPTENEAQTEMNPLLKKVEKFAQDLGKAEFDRLPLRQISRYFDNKSLLIHKLDKTMDSPSETFKLLFNNNPNLLQDISDIYPWTKNFSVLTESTILRLSFYKIDLNQLKILGNTDEFKMHLKKLICFLMNNAGFVPDYMHIDSVLTNYFEYGVIILVVANGDTPIGISSGILNNNDISTRGVYISNEFQTHQLGNALIYLLNKILYSCNFHSPKKEVVFTARSANPSVIYKFPGGTQIMAALHKLAFSFKEYTNKSNTDSLNLMLKLELLQPDLSDKKHQQSIAAFYRLLNSIRCENSNTCLATALYKSFIKIISASEISVAGTKFPKLNRDDVIRSFLNRQQQFYDNNIEIFSDQDSQLIKKNWAQINRIFLQILDNVIESFFNNKFQLSEFRLLALASSIWDYLAETSNHSISSFDDVTNIFRKYQSLLGPYQHFNDDENFSEDFVFGFNLNQIEPFIHESISSIRPEDSEWNTLLKFLNKLNVETKKIFKKTPPSEYFGFGYLYTRTFPIAPVPLPTLKRINTQASWPFDGLGSGITRILLGNLASQYLPGSSKKPFKHSDLTNNELSKISVGGFLKLKSSKVTTQQFKAYLRIYYPADQIKISETLQLIELNLNKLLLLIFDLNKESENKLCSDQFCREIIKTTKQLEAICPPSKTKVAKTPNFFEVASNDQIGTWKLKKPHPKNKYDKTTSDATYVWGKNDSNYSCGDSKKVDIMYNCLNLISLLEQQIKPTGSFKKAPLDKPFINNVKQFFLNRVSSFESKLSDSNFFDSFTDEEKAKLLKICDEVWAPEILGDIFLTNLIHQQLNHIHEQPSHLVIVTNYKPPKFNVYTLTEIKDTCPSENIRFILFNKEENCYEPLTSEKIQAVPTDPNDTELTKLLARPNYQSFYQSLFEKIASNKSPIIEKSIAHYFGNSSKQEFKSKSAHLVYEFTKLKKILYIDRDQKGGSASDQPTRLKNIIENISPELQEIIKYILLYN